MTSEGQHAGQQPTEATSGGGGAEPYGAPAPRTTDGSRSDSSPDRSPAESGAAQPPAAPQTAWGPDAYPNSYGPPPYGQPGSGSPFVVPAVPVFSPSTASSSADPAQPAPAQPPPYSPGGLSGFNSFGVVGPGPTTGSREPGSTAGSRAPGRSAFGDQRVRVPGATLGDLPDAPAEAGPISSGPVGGGPVNSDPTGAGGSATGGAVASAPVRQTSSGLPVRASGAQTVRPGEPGYPTNTAPTTGSAAQGFTPGQGFPSAQAFPAQAAVGQTGPAGQTASKQSDFRQASPISGGSGFTVRSAASGGSLPARRQEADNPYAAAAAQVVAAPRPGLFGDVQAGSAAVPQPRTPVSPAAMHEPAVHESSPHESLPHESSPADHPRPGSAQPTPASATGTARPVSASASVPMTSRVAPPSSADEMPPAGAPRARVYGRPAQSHPAQPDAGASDGVPFGTAQHGTTGFALEQPGPASKQPGPASEQHGPASEQHGPASEQHGPASEQHGPASEQHGRGPEQGGGRQQPPARPTGRVTASARVAPPVGIPPYAPGSPGSPVTRPGSPATPGAYGSPAGNGSAAGNGVGAGQGPQDQPSGVPFGDFTTELASRGRGEAAPQGAPFGEHTTDLAGRGRAPEQPYVPAPALPALHPSVLSADGPNGGFPPMAPEQNWAADQSAQSGGFTTRNHDQNSGQGAGQPGRVAMGGVFPDPATRATVTAPSPAETSSWPPVENAEQGRFDAFKSDAAPAAEKVEPPAHVRKLPVLLAVLLVSALLVGGSLGIVWLLARPSAQGFSVNPGDCVKRAGDRAVTATCGDADAFEVVSKVDSKEQCADPTQPYVLNPAGNGRNQVLCLKPHA